MGQAGHHYLIFETAGGFCGIAWNSAGTPSPVCQREFHRLPARLRCRKADEHSAAPLLRRVCRVGSARPKAPAHQKTKMRSRPTNWG
jgi:hypothetical protein